VLPVSRKILIQVSAPTVLIGLVLFVACLVSAWLISRQQRDLARLLSREVTSLQAAQELQTRVRQLRFHRFLDAIDPEHSRRAPIEAVHRNVEEAVERMEKVARTPEERAKVEKIRAGYQRYRQELGSLPAELARERAKSEQPPDLHRLADAHPVKYVVDPCQDLLHVTKKQMEETVHEGEHVSRLVRLAMLGLGVIAPLSGLLSGYGIARGLSRAIYQLSVRVQDMAQHLDQSIASMTIPAGGDIQALDKQLQYVVSRVVEVARDYHRQQRELLRAEQLSAVGQLAASVAHEVRNPLTSVKLLVEGALRPRDRRPLSDEDLGVIHGEVVRLEQTVQAFLDFARPPALKRVRCDLRDVVGQAVELVRARARQVGVSVEVAGGDEAAAVEIDRGQCTTVLVNLFLNALDAMPRGGRLRVSLAVERGGGYRLDVADTGPGIAPEIAPRLFTPFASSKPTGTGLGLSISRRIVEEHGGSLTAANRPAGGACFSITLPARQTDKETSRQGDKETDGQGQ
jgi:two-component system, NtrC family, sensor histidine kinase HydH